MPDNETNQSQTQFVFEQGILNTPPKIQQQKDGSHAILYDFTNPENGTRMRSTMTIPKRDDTKAIIDNIRTLRQGDAVTLKGLWTTDPDDQKPTLKSVKLDAERKNPETFFGKLLDALANKLASPQYSRPPITDTRDPSYDPIRATHAPNDTQAPQTPSQNQTTNSQPQQSPPNTAGQNSPTMTLQDLARTFDQRKLEQKNGHEQSMPDEDFYKTMQQARAETGTLTSAPQIRDNIVSFKFMREKPPKSGGTAFPTYVRINMNDVTGTPIENQVNHLLTSPIGTPITLKGRWAEEQRADNPKPLRFYQATDGIASSNPELRPENTHTQNQQQQPARATPQQAMAALPNAKKQYEKREIQRYTHEVERPNAEKNTPEYYIQTGRLRDPVTSFNETHYKFTYTPEGSSTNRRVPVYLDKKTHHASGIDPDSLLKAEPGSAIIFVGRWQKNQNKQNYVQAYSGEKSDNPQLDPSLPGPRFRAVKPAQKASHEPPPSWQANEPPPYDQAHAGDYGHYDPHDMHISGIDDHGHYQDQSHAPQNSHSQEHHYHEQPQSDSMSAPHAPPYDAHEPPPADPADYGHGSNHEPPHWVTEHDNHQPPPTTVTHQTAHDNMDDKVPYIPTETDKKITISVTKEPVMKNGIIHLSGQEQDGQDWKKEAHVQINTKNLNLPQPVTDAIMNIKTGDQLDNYGDWKEIKKEHWAFKSRFPDSPKLQNAWEQTEWGRQTPPEVVPRQKNKPKPGHEQHAGYER